MASSKLLSITQEKEGGGGKGREGLTIFLDKKQSYLNIIMNIEYMYVFLT